MIAPPTPPPPLPAPLAAVHTFAFAIGDGAERRPLTGYDLVVVDGEATSAARVAALRARGAIVLAYLSVGTIEPGRSWYRAAKPFRLPDRFVEYGEWYAATSKAGYRHLIAHRVAPRMLRKGFDGLFLDNTDMVGDHPAQTRGMRTLIHELAHLTHGDRRRRFLFSQNGDSTIGPSLHDLDGWNREDVTSTYDFGHHRYRRVTTRETRAAQRTLRRFRARGLLVTSSDYTRAGDATTDRAALSDACAAGALPFVSNIGLTRIPARPARCP